MPIGRFRFDAALAMVLSHHDVADHPPGFTNVELLLPTVRTLEFVATWSPARYLAPDKIRYSGMVGHGPH